MGKLKGSEATKLKFQKEYLANPSYCKQCDTMLPQAKKRNKFCDKSCAASHNNKGVRRHGKGVNNCLVCKKPTATSKEKYCSQKCAGEGKRFRTPDEIRTRRNEVSANYRASLKEQTPGDADREGMKKYYEGCPIGHEVDHKIPISKGGLHTLENLQYLTITENRSKGNKIMRL